MGNIPPLLASHLRETERRRRTLSPRGTTGVSGDPPRFVQGVKIKSLIKFISTELPESYDGLMDKVYSWLQAEETASEGRPVTFMDNGGGKPQKGRPQKGSGRKNKERELKSQIEEVVRSGKLAHSIKGIRKGKAKQGEAQLEE
ncbi:hypothetical protein Tco_0803879 [Tanacetum coccineum]|uniref:Uncharacterized protein n=1 Tax=Tanacetum coccineum TaxID=301880 RepID=A0ABQ5A5B4_9ASTR